MIPSTVVAVKFACTHSEICDAVPTPSRPPPIPSRGQVHIHVDEDAGVGAAPHGAQRATAALLGEVHHPDVAELVGECPRDLQGAVRSVLALSAIVIRAVKGTSVDR